MDETNDMFVLVDLESIERVPDAVADNRILGKFKEM